MNTLGEDTALILKMSRFSIAKKLPLFIPERFEDSIKHG
jgi:hypothetical protein